MEANEAAAPNVDVDVDLEPVLNWTQQEHEQQLAELRQRQLEQLAELRREQLESQQRRQYWQQRLEMQQREHRAQVERLHMAHEQQLIATQAQQMRTFHEHQLRILDQQHRHQQQRQQQQHLQQQDELRQEQERRLTRLEAFEDERRRYREQQLMLQEMRERHVQQLAAMLNSHEEQLRDMRIQQQQQYLECFPGLQQRDEPNEPPNDLFVEQAERPYEADHIPVILQPVQPNVPIIQQHAEPNSPPNHPFIGQAEQMYEPDIVPFIQQPEWPNWPIIQQRQPQALEAIQQREQPDRPPNHPFIEQVEHLFEPDIVPMVEQPQQPLEPDIVAMIQQPEQQQQYNQPQDFPLLIQQPEQQQQYNQPQDFPLLIQQYEQQQWQRRPEYVDSPAPIDDLAHLTERDFAVFVTMEHRKEESIDWDLMNVRSLHRGEGHDFSAFTIAHAFGARWKLSAYPCPADCLDCQGSCINLYIDFMGQPYRRLRYEIYILNENDEEIVHEPAHLRQDRVLGHAICFDAMDARVSNLMTVQINIIELPEDSELEAHSRPRTRVPMRHEEVLGARMLSLLEQGLYVDMNVSFGNEHDNEHDDVDENRLVRAHRCIVSLSSLYFRYALDQDRGPPMFHAQGPDVVRALIHYVYDEEFLVRGRMAGRRGRQYDRRRLRELRVPMLLAADAAVMPRVTRRLERRLCEDGMSYDEADQLMRYSPNFVLRYRQLLHQACRILRHHMPLDDDRILL